MFTIVLTIIFCLTSGVQYEKLEETNTTTVRNFDNDIIYNIYDYLKELYLQRCALVAIGLKNFAIFVEQASKTGSDSIRSKKYFLGMCHQDVLEDWTFCSPKLESKKPHKCRFKLRDGKYHGRVHRRFCDLKVMQNNKDCQCVPTIYDEQMFKVEGFPTCYIPPLPDTLCKYNVCGLAGCKTATVESRVHTVECDPKCRGANPFCEYPLDKSAKLPLVESGWSRWTRDDGGGNRRGQRRSVSTCVNKKTGKGDVDCLGPGGGCCSKNPKHCSCSIYEDNGQLIMEKIRYNTTAVSDRRNEYTTQMYSEIDNIPEEIDNRDPRDTFRYVRETDEFMSDDDSEGKEELDDIVLEEVTKPQDELCRTLDDAIAKGNIQHAKDDECSDSESNGTQVTGRAGTSITIIIYRTYFLELAFYISILLIIKIFLL